MKNRRLLSLLYPDLLEKMVFLAGPRQCGKTTLAEEILKTRKGKYYNWDIDQHRLLIQKSNLDEASPLWVFDELHKFRRWRNWLKGPYDLHRHQHSILVTGSARLELYSRGGDSLQGRYYLHHLHPFTLSEFVGTKFIDSDSIPSLGKEVSEEAVRTLDDLMQLGGFPEVLIAASARKAARWRLSYGSRLVQEDVRSLEQVQEIERVELLYDRLPEIVGSVLSINSLREDLEVAFATVRSWLAILDRLYACFRIAPFGAPRLKAVKKEQKLYLWDWARVRRIPACIENLVAVHLMRLRDWCEDIEGIPMEIRYFRDVVGHEVDFLVLRNKKPWMAIEVKESEGPLDPNLRYLLERVKIPYAFQLHLNGNKDIRLPDINACRLRLLPAARFLMNLP